MRSIFEVTSMDDLPPAYGGGVQLAYIDDEGQLRGSATLLESPAAPMRVEVDAPPATIAIMKADGRFVWVEDLE